MKPEIDCCHYCHRVVIYVGGIAQKARRAAPWFILGVMLFSYAVHVFYIDRARCSHVVGIYRVVKEMGGKQLEAPLKLSRENGVEGVER